MYCHPNIIKQVMEVYIYTALKHTSFKLQFHSSLKTVLKGCQWSPHAKQNGQLLVLILQAAFDKDLSRSFSKHFFHWFFSIQILLISPTILPVGVFPFSFLASSFTPKAYFHKLLFSVCTDSLGNLSRFMAFNRIYRWPFPVYNSKSHRFPKF